MMLLAPNPTAKLDFYQAFLNSACEWFSCDVRGTSTIAIRGYKWDRGNI
jgi:hypothetical protein